MEEEVRKEKRVKEKGEGAEGRSIFRGGGLRKREKRKQLSKLTYSTRHLHSRQSSACVRVFIRFVSRLHCAKKKD